MKRLRRISERVATDLDGPKLSVAPLIDVSFLLLAYFILTTTIQSAERDLSINLPTPSGGPSELLAMRLVLEEEGNLVLNPGREQLVLSRDPQDRRLLELRSHLKSAQLGGRPPTLVIAVEDTVDHQRVVNVLNILQELEWNYVGLEEWLSE